MEMWGRILPPVDLVRLHDMKMSELIVVIPLILIVVRIHRIGPVIVGVVAMASGVFR
jgi:hypothetical protein